LASSLWQPSAPIGISLPSAADMLRLLLLRGASGVDGVDARANYVDDPPGVGPSATPLHLAARFTNAAAVSLLLGAGADVNAVDHLHQTPLHIAVAHNNTDVLGPLLRTEGVDVNARANYVKDPPGTSPSATPLHFAAVVG